MTLRERWKSESSNTGHIFKTWIFWILAAITAVGGTADVLIGLPQDWVPSWLKVVVVISMILSKVGGNLTVKEKAAEKNTTGGN